MAKTTNTSNPNDTMALMRAYLDKMLIANTMRFSRAFEEDSKPVLEETIGMLSKSLAEHAARHGRKIIEDGAATFVLAPGVTDNPLTGSTISAKIYTEWAERPVDLLIFAVQAMVDAKDKEKRRDEELQRQRERYTKLLERLLAAKNMKEVKAALKDDDYYDD